MSLARIITALTIIMNMQFLILLFVVVLLATIISVIILIK